jgi:hypothetical protein
MTDMEPTASLVGIRAVAEPAVLVALHMHDAFGARYFPVSRSSS